MRTNTNKLISGALVASMTLISGVSAAVIGSGSVVDNPGLSGSVLWDDTFPGTATGTINGLTVKAQIQPTLSMIITGSGVIDLGILSSASYQTGTVSIEIGTNAVNGATVTANSTNGGLQNMSDSGQLLNNLALDGTTDSYRFNSVIGTNDSTITGFSQAATLNTEVNDTTSKVLYTSNKPQALDGNDDFTFSVSAKPHAQSPAGNYEDKVQVNVVGSF